MAASSFDYASCFVHHIRLYKVCGFWKPNPKARFGRLYHFYFVVFITFTLISILSELTSMYLFRTDIDEVTGTLFVFCVFFLDLIKIIPIYANLEDLKMFINNLNGDIFKVKNLEQYLMAERAKAVGIKYLYFLLYMGLQTDILWFIMPFIAEEGVMFKGWLPYDTTSSLNCRVTNIFQGILFLWHTVLVISMDSTYICLTIQIGLQCDLLSNTLENLGQYWVKNGLLCQRQDRRSIGKDMNENLIACIQHHKAVLRMADTIEKLYSISSFGGFITGGLLLCCTLFQLSNINGNPIEFFRLFYYLLCMFLQQCNYCWFGNEVKLKSEKLLNSAFKTPWPDCDVKFKKHLIQFMMRLQRPVVLKAGGLVEMSVDTLLGVVRTSYSYFTFLKGLGE